MEYSPAPFIGDAHVRIDEIPVRGLKLMTHGCFSRSSHTSQNRRNPRQGIETNHAVAAPVPGTTSVRIDEIPVRGLKLLPPQWGHFSSSFSQNRRNPRQGIETRYNGYSTSWQFICQNRRNPRQGIETIPEPSDNIPCNIVRIDEIPVRGLKLSHFACPGCSRNPSE